MHPSPSSFRRSDANFVVVSVIWERGLQCIGVAIYLTKNLGSKEMYTEPTAKSNCRTQRHGIGGQVFEKPRKRKYAIKFYVIIFSHDPCPGLSWCLYIWPSAASLGIFGGMDGGVKVVTSLPT